MYFQSLIIKTKESNLDKVIDFIKNKYQMDFIVDTIESSNKSIGVEDTKIINQILSKKNLDKPNLILIPRADTLTIQAQNSILKVLEEPSFNKLICLVTENPANLTQTILSRCQIQNLDSQNLDEDLYNFNEILQMSFINRQDFLEGFTKKDRVDVEGFLIKFIEYLAASSFEADLTMAKRNSDLSESLFKIFKGVKKGVNIKLCLDLINIKLTEFNY